MPFVKITTSQALDAHQREELRQAVWGAIVIIPQKFPETTMIQIEDKADITKGPGRASPRSLQKPGSTPGLPLN